MLYGRADEKGSFSALSGPQEEHAAARARSIEPCRNRRTPGVVLRGRVFARRHAAEVGNELGIGIDARVVDLGAVHVERRGAGSAAASTAQNRGSGTALPARRDILRRNPSAGPDLHARQAWNLAGDHVDEFSLIVLSHL